MEFLLSSITALWLGILTSIFPCPLATNITAMSYVSHKITKKGIIILSGILYTIGRSLTYIIVGFLIVKAFINIPLLSNFLQEYINKILGILLILVGLLLLGLFNMNFSGISVSENIQKRIGKTGLLGSLFLGVLFALAFCPVSAGLFFGGLIPIAIKFKSVFIMPFLYGIGTSIPVLVFALLIAFGTKYLNKFYQNLTRIEYYTKRITGVIFILAGIYYVLAYIFKVL